MSGTHSLPIRLNPGKPQGAFEVDLDHLIDYLRPVLYAAAARSTQLDYPIIAEEYLRDLESLKIEMCKAPLSNAEKEDYGSYLEETRTLLRALRSLPVPPEGHLGFRKQSIESFQFLIDDYSFELVQTSPILVQFATSLISVKLSYSPDCPMDSVLVAQRTSGGPMSGFILDDFAYAAGQGVTFDYSRFNLHSATGIADFLRAASLLIRRQGNRLLTGDSVELKAFQDLADLREKTYVDMLERRHSAQR